MATKGKTANAKRKVRRFTEGGMSDEDVRSFAGTPENESNAGMEQEAGMYEKEPDENFRPAVKAKAPVVTKEQLAKTGLSLRDYMNKQQGLKPRGAPAAAADEVSKYSADREQARKAPATSKYETAKSELMSAKPSREDTQKGLEIIAGGGAGAGLKAAAALARKMAAAKAAQGVEKFAEYSTPILEMAKRRIGLEPLKLGMKKGGAVKKMASGGSVRSTASRRGDGIATKGKTKGRMV